MLLVWHANLMARMLGMALSTISFFSFFLSRSCLWTQWERRSGEYKENVEPFSLSLLLPPRHPGGGRRVAQTSESPLVIPPICPFFFFFFPRGSCCRTQQHTSTVLSLTRSLRILSQRSSSIGCCKVIALVLRTVDDVRDEAFATTSITNLKRAPYNCWDSLMEAVPSLWHAINLVVLKRGELTVFLGFSDKRD